MDRVFWPAALAPPHGAGALIVGFNLKFDLARVAVACRQARRRGQGWSLIMAHDMDPATGLLRENPFLPRIRITPKDSKAAFIRFAGVSIRKKRTKRRLKRFSPGRWLDTRTLGFALRNESFKLKTACEAFNVPGKLEDYTPTGRVTTEEVIYGRQDVRATVGLLNAMRVEFNQHPVSLRPDRAYSPASFAKAYLAAMGVRPPAEKFAIPLQLQGTAMQSYFGGRCEARIRHTVVPIMHVDVRSEYATVNTLLGLWRYLTAARLRVEDATEDVQKLLNTITLNRTFDPALWKQLVFFALVRPDGDVLPVRTVYNDRTTNIGVNPLTSETPLWYAGPDLVNATWLTRRPPSIVRAIRIVPEGQQDGLKP
jgi:hypothetical protein